nr:DUF3105 domain-containing protein [Angustibacter aerolatus]
MEEARRKQRAADRRRATIIWGTAVVVVLAIAGAVTFAILREKANTPSLAAVKTYTEKRDHVTTAVTYDVTPPVGGDHNPVWLNCGIYTKAVPNVNAVHSMEHGAVWITYRPDLPAADVKKATDATPDTYAILSPYPDLPAPVVVSAWDHRLRLTGADDPRLAEFIRTYRQGPQTPEPGAACTGGTDGSDTTTTGPAPTTSASPSATPSRRCASPGTSTTPRPPTTATCGRRTTRPGDAPCCPWWRRCWCCSRRWAASRSGGW